MGFEVLVMRYGWTFYATILPVVVAVIRAGGVTGLEQRLARVSPEIARSLATSASHAVILATVSLSAWLAVGVATSAQHAIVSRCASYACAFFAVAALMRAAALARFVWLHGWPTSDR